MKGKKQYRCAGCDILIEFGDKTAKSCDNEIYGKKAVVCLYMEPKEFPSSFTESFIYQKREQVQ